MNTIPAREKCAGWVLDAKLQVSVNQANRMERNDENINDRQ
jgi:hypothetical protein